MKPKLYHWLTERIMAQLDVYIKKAFQEQFKYELEEIIRRAFLEQENKNG